MVLLIQTWQKDERKGSLNVEQSEGQLRIQAQMAQLSMMTSQPLILVPL